MLPLVAFLASAVLSAWASASDTIRFQTFSSHSRIQFRIDESVPVEWKDTPQGFEAFFKGLTLVDFGAPFGDESKWAQQFAQLQESRLASIQFKDVPGGVKAVGTWKFLSGPNAPAEPRMETFNYREKNPSTFVVDFWVKQGPTVAEVQVLQKAHAKKVAVQKVQHQIKARVDRRIASQKEKESKNDLTKFCREPLKDGWDVFLPFYAVHQPVDFSKYISPTTPDHDFPYYRPTAKSKEAQYVRLALDLYREGKAALAIRTIDFLNAEFPESQHRDEMMFLRANAMLKLGMTAEAERILEDIKLKARGTPVALHAGMFLAGKQVEKKNSLAAHEAFAWLIQNYPDHSLSWLFHLGAAEQLYAIKETERASSEYQWVVENAKTPEQRAEGALRLGDIYLDRFQYEQALGAYSQGIRYFGKQATLFPAVYLNRAEALLGLKQFDAAKADFEAYLEKFPTYPEGWRAALRIGEIWGRQSGAVAEKKSRDWYYDTINRFPFSPGSTLARLRLLPCGDHGGFTYEAAVRFLEGDAQSLNAPEDLAMSKYPDFRVLTQVRALIAFGKEDQAIDIAQKQIALTRVPEIKQELQADYEVLFRRNILAMLDAGKKYEALAFFRDRSSYLGKNIGGTDPDYLLKLSYAASDLGLGKLGESLATEYQKAAHTERSLASGGPALKPDLEAQLATSEQRFAEAKALWISSGIAAEAKIREKLAQVVTESPRSLEREVILGLLEEKLKHPTTALPHVVKAELLASAGPGGASDLLRIRAWLADVQARSGDSKVALDLYRGLEKQVAPKKDEEDQAESPKMDLLGVAPLPSYEQVLIAEAAILEKRNQWGEAASAYSRAMDAGIGGNQAMYGYARALLKKGDASDREKALSMLDKLSQSKTNDFWKKIGTETLNAERTPKN